MDEVYNKLIQLESEYLINQVTNQGYFEKDEELLVDKIKKEAHAVRTEIKGNEKELKVLTVVKNLNQL